MSKATSDHVRQHVVAFRLTTEELEECNQKYEIDRPTVNGVRTLGMMARKVFLDYARDKVKWPNKKDKYLAPEVQKASETRRSLVAKDVT